MEVNIHEREPFQAKFKDLLPGKPFTDKKEIFIKTEDVLMRDFKEGSSVNAIYLRDGCGAFFADEVMVYPLDGGSGFHYVYRA